MSTLLDNAGSQVLRSLIDKLRALSADKYVDLPQIAVMGDTSSGKSSVLSAISGITFPSNNELTTRCPTQLILSESAEFSGTIRLKRYVPRPDDEPVTTLSSPTEIGSEIQRLTEQLVSENQSISDDEIIVEVSGPTYPNITLTDLPGLVRTVQDNEDPAIIRRIRALVDRYLVQKRTVILAVVPANVDVHNTEILQAAEQADPDGLRTISIITKPDLVDIGAEKQVIDLLMNRKKSLKLGYHVVKCRGQRDLDNDMTIQEGIQQETVFFSEHKVWGQVDPSYVGVGRLTEKLVKILESIIARSLPAVIKDIEVRLGTCKQKLENMGTSLDTGVARRMFYFSFVDQVQELISSALNGNYNNVFFELKQDGIDNRARAIIRKEETIFREIICKTEMSEKLSEVGPTTAQIGDLVEVLIGGTWITKTVSSVNISNHIRYSNAPAWIVEENWKRLKVYDLRDLKTEIEDNRGKELAIFPSYNLFCKLVQKLIREWEKPMTKLLDQCQTVLTGTCLRAVEQLISSRLTKTKDFSCKVIVSAIQEAKVVTAKALQDCFKSEHTPYTLNHYLYDVLIKMRSEPLIESLEKLCTGTDRNVNMDAVLAILKNHGVGKVSNEDREALELHIAIKAYIKVAKKRFTDIVPQMIQFHFIQAVEVQIKRSLIAVNDQQLETILEEPMSTMADRARLEAELASLTASIKEISSLYYGM